MRTHLTRLTHLFALLSMCYLPEWDMVNNNNKYTHNINGDINGMLTRVKNSIEKSEIYLFTFFSGAPYNMYKMSHRECHIETESCFEAVLKLFSSGFSAAFRLLNSCVQAAFGTALRCFLAAALKFL